MKYIALLLLLTNMSVLAHEGDFSFRVGPYFDAIILGELEKSGTTELTGETSGYALGLLLGARYKSVGFGFDYGFTNFHAKDVIGSALTNDISHGDFSGSTFGFYLDYTFRSFLFRVNYYLLSNFNEAGVASYEGSTSNHKFSVSYIFKNQIALGLFVGNYEGDNSMNEFGEDARSFSNSTAGLTLSRSFNLEF